MKENYLIKINGLQMQDDEKNDVTLSTRGNFVEKNGKYYIIYKESETTGYLGCTTTVKVEGENKVSMTRQGPMPSQLIIEKNNRNVCHYETGYGSLALGISANYIKNNLTSEGGKVEFAYEMDLNSSSISTNTIKIDIKRS